MSFRCPTVFLLGAAFFGLTPAAPRALAAGDASAADPEGIAFFEKHVRPLLSKHCYKCHSSRSEKLRGGLLLDSQHGWVTGGDSGEAVVPGDPEASLIIRAVRYADPDLQMPPKYRLDENAVAALEKWVALGAPDPRQEEAAPARDTSLDVAAGRSFWAFQPPRDSPPPAVRDSAWSKDPLDRFILTRLEQEGLQPVEDADRLTLVRRLTLDLTGLPPLPEIRAFTSDPRPDDVALAALADRLLASPRFGERWGRHWLDVVRFAESMGRTRNIPFPYAWRYRDYVIDSFNADKPYDRFLREQLAGDLLPASSPEERREALVATGFLALGSLDLNENNAAQFLMDRVDEQIDTVTRSVTALTVGCARCHDHKFDPIPTEDYYRLAGIFRSTEVLGGYVSRRGGNGRDYFDPTRLVALTDAGTPPAGEAEVEARREELQRARNLRQKLQQLRARQQRLAPVARGEGGDLPPRQRERARQQLQEVRASMEDLRKKLAAAEEALAPSGDVAMAVSEADRPQDCRVHVRGEPGNLGPSVPRGFPAVLVQGEGYAIPKDASGRREFADWLADPRHPLTARVMANRVWHHLFGRGLVRTVDNFGQSGERPTHPELLDQLAVRFTESGWSVKDLVRSLVLSRTYRLSSRFDAANDAADPDNLLHWRMSPRRLEAEAIRDALLACSGDLRSGRPEGSAVSRAAQEEMRQPGRIIEDAFAEPVRSVYLPVVRDHLPHMLEIFDFPHPAQVSGSRDVTTVATQALYFMNNPFVAAQARTMAKRLLSGSTDPAERIREAWMLALNRPPTETEVRQAQLFLGDPAAADTEAWTRLCQSLFASAEFRYLQ